MVQWFITAVDVNYRLRSINLLPLVTMKLDHLSIWNPGITNALGRSEDRPKSSVVCDKISKRCSCVLVQTTRALQLLAHWNNRINGSSAVQSWHGQHSFSSPITSRWYIKKPRLGGVSSGMDKMLWQMVGTHTKVYKNEHFEKQTSVTSYSFLLWDSGHK